MRTTVTIAALCAFLIAVPGVRNAAAQDEDAEITRMAKEHYKLGLEAFKTGKYPEAIKELKKAYLLKRLPPLLINIAKTYEKLNDPDNAIYYYKKYLAEAPAEAKDRDAITQAIADVEAIKSGKTVAPPPEEAPVPEATPTKTRRNQPPPSDNPPPDRAPDVVATNPGTGGTQAEWTHTPIDAVPPNQPVDVRVQTPVMKGVKVFLYYRGKGQADFTEVEMKRRGSEKVGRIPGDMLNGKSIQYYIEAKDGSGNVLKNSGAQTDPNIVMVDPTAKPMIIHREGDPDPTEDGGEGNPAEVTPPPTKSHGLDDAPPLHEGGIDDQPPLGVTEKPAAADKKPRKKLPFTTLGWVGIGLAAVGIGGLAAGAALTVKAEQYASTVNGDAYSPSQAQSSCSGLVPGMTCPPYLFNDPSFSASNQADFNFQQTGKTDGLVGPILIGVGSAFVVTGAVLVVVDILNQRPAPPKAIKKKRRRRARPVEEDSGDQPTERADPPAEDRPPRDESSSIRNFMVAPSITPTSVGVGAGFSF